MVGTAPFYEIARDSYNLVTEQIYLPIINWCAEDLSRIPLLISLSVVGALGGSLIIGKIKRLF